MRPGTAVRFGGAALREIYAGSINEVFSRNFQMKTFPPLCRTDAPYHVLTHMELWVLSQALTDRTRFTCLYAVYSMTARVRCSLVFSFCVTQISPPTGSASGLPQKSPKGQNVSAAAFFLFFFLLLHPALFLVLFVFIVSKPHAERANSRSYSLQMFVSPQNKTKICPVVNPPACAL